MKRHLFFVGIVSCLLPVMMLLPARLVNFDTSMGKGDSFYNKCVRSQGGFSLAVYPHTASELLSLFRKLYEQNNFFKLGYHEDPRTPKIMHHIWLGDELSNTGRKYRQTWLEKHKDWLCILWVDNPVNFKEGEIVLHTAHELQSYLYAPFFEHKKIVVDIKAFPLYNQAFYDEAACYGEKSDLLKWEIVYRFGGVYIDTDFECLKPIDVFHHCYDFYVGIQPLDVEVLALGASLFGAAPGSTILKHCIEKIKDYRDYVSAWRRTGPIPFTRAFFEEARACGGTVIALPST